MHDALADPLDRGDAVMQKENLALPFQFPINRGANDPFIVRRHDRFDWQTIERGSLDSGHVFHAHQ